MSLEIKINKEIREYTESMFFGLSMRQFIFSFLACAVAVAIYFLLRPYVGTEIVSWLCIICAFPFAVLGFVKYNGMPAEKLIWAIVKSELLYPKQLVFKNNNMYYNIMQEANRRKKKERRKKNDKNTQNDI